MLFNACNCVAGSSLAATLAPLCAGGAGFVSAMIAAMVANAQTAPARALGRDVPEVDRLAVRMVTDNVIVATLGEACGYEVDTPAHECDAGINNENELYREEGTMCAECRNE